MYFRETDTGYICSEGVTGVPVRMLLCPHCLEKFRNDPYHCLLKYAGYGEEQVTVLNPAGPEEIVETPDTVEYVKVICPQCHTEYKFAINDVYWRNYLVTVQYETSAIKYAYLEGVLKDAGVPEERAFLFIKSAVEERLRKLRG